MGETDGKVCGCFPKAKASTVKRKSKFYWSDFSKSTALQGFDWVESARCPLERVLFVILILFGIAFTVKDVAILTIQFTSEEKQTKAVIMDNDTFVLNMTLCIDIETTNLRTPGVNTSNSVTKLLNEFANKDILPFLSNLTEKPVKKWTDPEKSLVSVTAQMLANIVRVENVAEFDYVRVTDEVLGSWGLFDKIPGDPTSQNITARPTLVIRPGTPKSMYEINQFYAKREVPFDKLMQTIGACLCKWMKVTFMPLSNEARKLRNKLKDQCKPELISWFGTAPKGGEWENLCIKPEFGIVKFDAELGFLDVSFEHKNIHNLDGLSDLNVYEFYTRGATAELDFSGERVYTVQTGSNAELVPLLRKELATMRINGYNQALNTDGDPCSGGISRADCWLGCRAAFIAKNCHCWPLSGYGLPNRPPEMPLCSSRVITNNTDYVNIPILTEPDTCGRITNSSIPDLECKKACLQNCEYALMGIAKEKFESTPPSFENMTIIRLTVQYFQYPFFQQSLQMSAVDYFNQLGGALGLYVGCSFIALFHVIIFPTHMIMDCLEKRKNRKLADGALNQWFTSSAKIGQGIENASAENNDLPGFGFNGIKGKDNPTVITVDDED